MREPRWLTRLAVDTMHAELLREHGVKAGTRDGGDELIEALLARPRNRLAYEPDSDLPRLAAAYLFGLGKNHGYIDGNKRIAFAAAATFLLLNGMRLNASEVDAYDVVVAVAAGNLGEEALAQWLRAKASSRSTSAGSALRTRR
jgi:death-on-curing protein